MEYVRVQYPRQLLWLGALKFFLHDRICIAWTPCYLIKAHEWSTKRKGRGFLLQPRCLRWKWSLWDQFWVTQLTSDSWIQYIHPWRKWTNLVCWRLEYLSSRNLNNVFRSARCYPDRWIWGRIEDRSKGWLVGPFHLLHNRVGSKRFLLQHSQHRFSSGLLRGSGLFLCREL